MPSSAFCGAKRGYTRILSHCKEKRGFYGGAGPCPAGAIYRSDCVGEFTGERVRDGHDKSYIDPYALVELAQARGWRSLDNVPLRGDGPFMALTLKGLERQVRNRSAQRSLRRADAWGPARCSVIAVESGNYLAAIAWRPIEEGDEA